MHGRAAGKLKEAGCGAYEAIADGFCAEDYGEVEVWPENWMAWRLFCSVSTQWRTSGMGGCVGLDYTPLMRIMDEHGLKGDEWLATLEGVQAVEAGALAQMRANEASGD